MTSSPPGGDAEPVVSVQDLRIVFQPETGRVSAVNGLSFQVAPGRALGLVGESGSGKSAVALALLGLHRGTGARVSGQVRVAGTEVLTASEEQLRRLRGGRIAMVFQDPLSSLDPYLTVGGQIAEVYRAHTGVGRRAAARRAVQVLDRVGIAHAARRAHAHPHEFSGGMRQRALIAMALACQPQVLVADEPTTALDVTVQAQILALLTELRAETGMALLLVSHDLGVVAAHTEEVLVMRAGQAVERGPVSRVLSRPGAPYTRALLAALPRVTPPGSASRLARSSLTHSSLARSSLAHSSLAAARLGAEPEVLLRVVDLHRHFPGDRGWGRGRPEPLRVVDGVTLDVRAGETLGLVGESGSGKTTLARMMVRLIPPTAGRVLLDGRDIAHMPEKRLRPLRRDLQMVFQDPGASFNPRRTVGESIADPMRVQRMGDEASVRARVHALLEQVGLEPDHARRYPHELSGGQRQRAGIARALGPRPRLVVCDEPISALDPPTQAQVVALLQDLQRELGLTLVFVAHDLAVVRQISDRVAVMRAGRVVELAETDTLYTTPTHPYTRRLLAAIPSVAGVGARSGSAGEPGEREPVA